MMWHNWHSTPPQIPNVPIHVRLDGEEWIDYIASIHEIGIVDGLEWRATGVYREEFWQTTGRWV